LFIASAHGSLLFAKIALISCRRRFSWPAKNALLSLDLHLGKASFYGPAGPDAARLMKSATAILELAIWFALPDADDGPSASATIYHDAWVKRGWKRKRQSATSGDDRRAGVDWITGIMTAMSLAVGGIGGRRVTGRVWRCVMRPSSSHLRK